MSGDLSSLYGHFCLKGVNDVKNWSGMIAFLLVIRVDVPLRWEDKRKLGSVKNKTYLAKRTIDGGGTLMGEYMLAVQWVVPPNKPLVCLNSFPFDETLKHNVLTNVARVFDFFSFEEYYLNVSPPFHESTMNIRAEVARIRPTTYDADYELNRDVDNRLYSQTKGCSHALDNADVRINWRTVYSYLDESEPIGTSQL
ncbi:hypothetical protein BC629DRAFT_1443081 [Irpex lacteus]|nr:hypothetical protein BC629DRAFT_1443081 [Irpex lacteus]